MFFQIIMLKIMVEEYKYHKIIVYKIYNIVNFLTIMPFKMVVQYKFTLLIR